MKNILYTCPSSGVGGAETFILQTLKHTDKERFRNHYLLFNGGPLYDALREQEARAFLLNEVPRISKLSSHRKVGKRVRDLINENNIDLVHSTMPYGAVFSSLPTWQMGVPHIWFQHGPVGGMMDRVASLLPHKGLIVNSHFTSHQQRRLENPFRLLIPRDNPIEKILLGTDLVKPPQQDTNVYTEKLQSRFEIPKEAVLIGMLCRIQKWKGVHLLIDAAEKLLKKTSIPFQIVVWGEAFKGQEYLNSLKAAVKSKSLPVVFPGLLKDVNLGLSSLDIIVNASTTPEPFGLSIIEGMMMGAIPVVPDRGGPCEIVSHGQDGLHFKSGEASSLAIRLETLVTNKDLRDKISEQSQKTAQIKFSAQRAIEQMEKFYTKILGEV